MSLKTRRILNYRQLKMLGDHKYFSEDRSILDPSMQPYWNYVVKLIPLWVAPNLITLTGLVINILTTFFIMWYSRDCTSDPPPWAHVLCAVGLFAYQTLDAIDGKQARRTSTSSPLGELFDHGCDSVSSIFVVLSVCITLRLGDCPRFMFFFYFCGITAFYCSHWQTFVSVSDSSCICHDDEQITRTTLDCLWTKYKKLSFSQCQLFVACSYAGKPSAWFFLAPDKKTKHIVYSVVSLYQGTFRFGKIDVTEAQVTIMCAHLTTAIFGGRIWRLKLLNFMEARFFVCFIAVLLCLLMIYNVFRIILAGGSGKNGSTVAGTSVLSPGIPLLTVILSGYVISQKSESHVYENHTVLFILTFGVIAAKVTNKLVVAHMTKSEMDFLDTSMLGAFALFLNQYFNCVIPEHIVLWGALIWALYDLLWYCWRVCVEICMYLRIQLFAIPCPTSCKPPLQSSDFIFFFNRFYPKQKIANGQKFKGIK